MTPTKLPSTRSRDNPEEKKATIKRYNLKMPERLFDELQTQSDMEGVPMVNLIRSFLQIGLIILAAQRSGATFYIREGEREREVILTI